MMWTNFYNICELLTEKDDKFFDNLDVFLETEIDPKQLFDLESILFRNYVAKSEEKMKKIKDTVINKFGESILNHIIENLATVSVKYNHEKDKFTASIENCVNTKNEFKLCPESNNMIEEVLYLNYGCDFTVTQELVKNILKKNIYLLIPTGPCKIKHGSEWTAYTVYNTSVTTSHFYNYSDKPLEFKLVNINSIETNDQYKFLQCYNVKDMFNLQCDFKIKFGYYNDITFEANMFLIGDKRMKSENIEKVCNWLYEETKVYDPFLHVYISKNKLGNQHDYR